MAYRDHLPAGAGHARPGYQAATSNTDLEDLNAQLYDGLPQRGSIYSQRGSIVSNTDMSMSGSQHTLGNYMGVSTNEKYASTDALATYPGSSPLPRAAARTAPKKSGKRGWWIGAGVAAALIIAGVVAGVIIAKNNSSNSSSSASDHAAGTTASGTSAAPSASASATPKVLATQGGDGSMVTTLEGNQTFVYNNTYGGYWVSIPFNDSARAQDDVPPLNQQWDYVKNNIRGVNLGGWLNTEPFIVPALYEPFVSATTPATDEWTLFTNLDAVSATNKATVMNKHYSTFITEHDFAQIAGAGLNWVRIPVPFYMFEVYPNEPFMTGQWTYLLKAMEWARKYGIRINLDLHSCPGSQNGYNHSGRGTAMVNCLKGAMGYANAQRMLNYIRTVTQFISQPQYSNIVPMLSILNEPMANAATATNGTGKAPMAAFYGQAYQIMRSISGTGSGKGPVMAIGDAFLGGDEWVGWLPNADRVAMDLHTYLIFGGSQSTASISTFAQQACSYGGATRTLMGNFGFTSTGEWSLAVNDCGQWVRGVGIAAQYEGLGSCTTFMDATTWSAATKEQYKTLASAWIDATQNSFFWTWKIGQNTAGTVPNPMWSLQLGLQLGYWPTNMRNLTGSCSRINGATVNAPFTGALPASATGAGAAVASADLAALAWPPVLLSTGATMYSYTQTQTPTYMPAYTPTSYSGSIPNGIGNPAATANWFTPAAGVAYGDAWGIAESPAILKRAPAARPTPAPGARRQRT